MERLCKRVQSGEIVIYPTDKSGKLAVTTLENYEKQGNEHVRGDRKIGWPEVQKIMNEVKGHLRALNKIFNTGSSHSKKSMERAWKAKEAMATILPNLCIFPKDHKPLKPDGQPKTRPVCGASETINQELSEWISTLIVGSLDAEALYPSLVASEVAKLCGRLVADQGLKVDNVDYKWASVYIACCIEPLEVRKEGLQDCVPKEGTPKARSQKSEV